MQYCIEDSYQRKTPLIVTSIDFSKAFDSVNRGKMIEALMHYKVHPKIIEIIVNIYCGDKTKVMMGHTENEMGITCGIRQGCTGSAILFELVTYMIINRLE